MFASLKLKKLKIWYRYSLSGIDDIDLVTKHNEILVQCQVL